MEKIDRKGIIGKSFIFLIITAFLMFLYESFKQLLFPHISIWASHIITIIIVSAFGSFLSYFYFLSTALKAMYAKEIDRRHQYQQIITAMNKNLEETVAERTESLQQMNEELSLAKRKAEEANRLKTVFLQNISHEICTPLNAIIGLSGIIENNYDNKDKLVSYSSIIKQNGTDLLGLITEILDASRLESGKMPVLTEIVCIDELMDELKVFATGLSERLKKEGVKFIVNNYNCPQNAIIATDKTKLKRIFTNLIHNAFKFTHSGVVEIGWAQTDDLTFSFYVSDTGIGIDDEQLPLIFERFIQIDDTLTRKYSGSGLGLSIVKGFIDLLNGTITVKSIKDEGSIFTFTIPDKIYETDASILVGKIDMGRYSN
ncbi:MAG: HAMP domain-containing sensor histidine kinase [Bacteroidota bacterium]|nr:HAMP domain-containing sensor histidine kinase [Bacteroidota bacterium]